MRYFTNTLHATNKAFEQNLSQAFCVTVYTTRTHKKYTETAWQCIPQIARISWTHLSDVESGRAGQADRVAASVPPENSLCAPCSHSMCNGWVTKRPVHSTYANLRSSRTGCPRVTTKRRKTDVRLGRFEYARQSLQFSTFSMS